MTNSTRPSDEMLRNYATGRANAHEINAVEQALFEQPDLLNEVLASEALSRALDDAKVKAARRKETAAVTPVVRERFAWAAVLLLAVGTAYATLGWQRETAEVARLRGAGFANVAIVSLSPSRGIADEVITLKASASGWLFELPVEPPLATSYVLTLEASDGTLLSNTEDVRVDERSNVSVFVPIKLDPGRTYVVTLRAAGRAVAQHTLRIR